MLLGGVGFTIPLEDEVAEVASHLRATRKSCVTSQVSTLASILTYHVLLSPQETNELKEKGHEDDLFGSQILRGQQN